MASEYYNSKPSNNQEPLPVQLCFFLLTLVLFIGLSWYLSLESGFESIINTIKFILILSPLVMLLAVQWISGGGNGRRDGLYGVEDLPWSVVLVLVLLLALFFYG